MGAVLNLPKTISIEKIYKAVEMAREQQAAVILSNVDWETYHQFIEDAIAESKNPLFYYENGNLLIMVKSPEHEFITDYIVLFINFVTVEWSINCGSFGSATFQKADVERGFEPDACFYFENEPKTRGVKRFDMSVHPAPDLIVEVDITSLSTFRQSIYASFGVPEIWRFDGEKIELLKLENGKYVVVEKSLSVPLVTPQTLTGFIKESQTLSRLEWIAKVRDWAKKAETRA